MKGLTTALVMTAVHTAEAARSFDGSSAAGPLAAFRDSHPVAMVLVNAAGISAIVLVCAVVLAALSKDPGDL